MIHETRTDRFVTTFSVDGWPVGILTGCERDWNTFYLEHVVVFPDSPRGTLVKMLRAGVEEAWAKRFACIVFCLPDGFPLKRGLEVAGKRLGFEAYTHEEGATWYALNK